MAVDFGVPALARTLLVRSAVVYDEIGISTHQ